MNKKLTLIQVARKYDQQLGQKFDSIYNEINHLKAEVVKIKADLKKS